MKMGAVSQLQGQTPPYLHGQPLYNPGAFGCQLNYLLVASGKSWQWDSAFNRKRAQQKLIKDVFMEKPLPILSKSLSRPLGANR